MVRGPMVPWSHGPLVCGPWSVVRGPWSVVGGGWWVVGGGGGGSNSGSVENILWGVIRGYGLGV